MNSPQAAKPISSIVVVGGGTAGWMTAALLTKLFTGKYKITVVESDDIGTIGVGEATIPAIKEFNALLDLPEQNFMRAVKGTFKLGIEFINWRKLNHKYIHGFGKIGRDFLWLRTHHYWLKMFPKGGLKDFDHYSINAASMMGNKMMHTREDMQDSPLKDLVSAFHMDAGLYAQMLRKFCEDIGTKRIEGLIKQTVLHPETGFIEKIVLASGEEVAGDFFIDCSGMHGVLIDKALGVGYEDWSHWLFCDRALAVPCESVDVWTPYTKSTAHGAGWQWRIPLQHRTGNGHVFSSRYMGEDEATSILMNHLDGKALADPRLIKFRPGRREKAWVKNCLAIGLSGGFIEPLESTSIHMIHRGIVRMVNLFPDMSFDQRVIDEYNRQTRFEYEDIRDFIITHYKVTEREDTAFWKDAKYMSIPEPLQERLNLFKQNARYFKKSHEELFVDESWIQVLIGQGLEPGYDPNVNLVTDELAKEFLKNVETVIDKCVQAMPAHKDYVRHYCAQDAKEGQLA